MLRILLQCILSPSDTLLIVVPEFNYMKTERPTSSNSTKYNQQIYFIL